MRVIRVKALHAAHAYVGAFSRRILTMPAKSKAQQKAAGAALAAKRGDQSKSNLKGATKSMEESMSEKELEELPATKRKRLPDKKKR